MTADSVVAKWRGGTRLDESGNPAPRHMAKVRPTYHVRAEHSLAYDQGLDAASWTSKFSSCNDTPPFNVAVKS